MNKRPLSFALFVIMLILSVWRSADAAQYASWNEIIDKMHVSLDGAYEAYAGNDAEEGKRLVNDAYFGYYEKEGVEKMVMSYISGKRATIVEYQFSEIKKLMTDGAPLREVRASIDQLKKFLREDANELDGVERSSGGIFAASLVIILREGFEAILVIAAIVAYLIRSGNQNQTRVVYSSAIAALVASAAAAVALQSIFNVSGANQEIIEGAAMLLAVVVLFFVSNWMISKAESEAWKQYIENKVQTAVETGSKFALGAAAFLAVFREGAETILFYQALLADSEGYSGMVWLGFAVGSVSLVFIFLLVRFGSLAIPIKPFFIGTSALMYIMSVAFAGGGVRELQEADVVSVTPVKYVQSVEILGIYPTIETLIPQIILLVLAIASFFYYRSRARRQRAAA